MLTEIEKYEKIQRFLANQFPLEERRSFEAEMKNSEALRTEVEMHRLANEIAIDHYVIGLKATTGKVLQQKALESRFRNWGLGLGFGILAIGLGWYLLQENKPTTGPSTQVTQITAQPTTPSTPSPAKELTNKTASPSKALAKEVAVASSGSAYGAKPTVVQEEQPASVTSAPVSSVTITPSSPTISLAPEKTVSIPNPAVVSKSTVKETENLKPAEKPSEETAAPIELVLNPLQGTEVELPVASDFTGEFTVFDANGASVYRCTIQNGQPHTWDGRVISGGAAGAGQYGFVLKSVSGRESIGYITVLR